MSDDIWGPWIDHDGKGCPCSGAMVESVDAGGVAMVHIAGGISVHPVTGEWRARYVDEDLCDLWDWAECAAYGSYDARIVRYRIRKSRGLILLQELIENLPAPVREREDA